MNQMEKHLRAHSARTVQEFKEKLLQICDKLSPQQCQAFVDNIPLIVTAVTQ